MTWYMVVWAVWSCPMLTGWAPLAAKPLICSVEQKNKLFEKKARAEKFTAKVADKAIENWAGPSVSIIEIKKGKADQKDMEWVAQIKE